MILGLRLQRPRVALSFALLGLLCLAPSARASGDALATVEAEFRAAIKPLTRATVVVLPRGVRGPRAGFSSGVIVTRDGLILSDGDAGVVFKGQGQGRRRERRDQLDVRVPNPAKGSFRTYRARVLFRDTDVDTSLIKILNPPSGGFVHVQPGHSDGLRVGDFALAVGSQTFENGGTQPSLTAGVVASFAPGKPDDEGKFPFGKYDFIYVSAAVNDGVNGGPLVDLDGRLVGTISTYLRPEPDQPFQFLGKAVPMDRIRTAMSGVAEAKRLFGGSVPEAESTTPAHALQRVFRLAAVRAAPAVVSLEIKRKRPVSGHAPLGQKTVVVPRYQGPVSGILVKADGHAVTHLYNLTNIAGLVEPFWEAPAEAGYEAGLEDIESAVMHMSGGGQAPAILVGVDRRHGLALWKADPEVLQASGAPDPLPVLAPAASSAFRRGRFVLALGNPHGGATHPDPLLAMGILSKFHATTAAAPWRGQWQTDAAGLDSNAGGAVVDMEGNLVGMLSLWLPVKHGRNSGVAFVLPHEQMMASVQFLLDGKTRTPGFLGIEFERGTRAVLRSIVEGTAAANSGLKAGDVLLSIDGHETNTLLDAISIIRQRTAGETVHVRYEREGETLETDVTLGARPGG